jgi:hypothetical protein
MHSDNATWETTLVIPETAKPIDVQMLDAFLRIEALLVQLLGKPGFVPASQEAIELIEEVIADAKPAKGKRSNGK